MSYSFWSRVYFLFNLGKNVRLMITNYGCNQLITTLLIIVIQVDDFIVKFVQIKCSFSITNTHFIFDRIKPICI